MRKRLLFFLTGCLAVLAGIVVLVSYVFLRSPMQREDVTLTTSDNVQIAAHYYPVQRSGGDLALVLVHMMPAAKEAWDEFAAKAQMRGIASIAIDLRGHGRSADGPNGYRFFSDAEHQASVADVAAAAVFLEEKGFAESAIALVGASIGANLSLQYAASHADVPAVVLLSPGLDYRGIATKPLVKKLRPKKQEVFFVSSEDDGTNAEENRILYDLTPDGAEKRILIYKRAGHGTDMFSAGDPDLAEEILKWLE